MKISFLTIAAIVAMILSVTGCGTASRARSVSVGFADFRPYISSGFWVSPDPYTGKFEPVGELSIRVTPAIRPETTGDGVYSATLYVPETIDPAELLELAYKEAKDKGANGIVNYKTQILTRTDVSHGISSTTVEAYIITGFLIKILD